ncbi:hypothetical protein Bca4012_071769 [Brassica carinata]
MQANTDRPSTCHLGETERKTREREQNKSTPFSLLSSLFSLVSLPCDICISRDRTRVPVVTTANRPLKVYLSRLLYPYDGDTNDLSSLLSVSVLSLSRGDLLSDTESSRSHTESRSDIPNPPLTYRIETKAVNLCQHRSLPRFEPTADSTHLSAYSIVNEKAPACAASDKLVGEGRPSKHEDMMWQPLVDPLFLLTQRSLVQENHDHD